MEENRFRNKIYWFTFWYSVLVVWVHSYNSELFLGRSAAAAAVYRIERFFGGTVAQIAVPGFFMISAYLFYRNFTWEKLQAKWLSRVRSVLLPFILWNGIYYLGYVIGSRLPFVSSVVGKGVIPIDLFTAADAILHYTYNYVFWYLYQLILLILLAPVLYQVLRNRYVGLGAVVLLFAVVRAGAVIPVLNLDALLYYSAAAWLAIHHRRLAEEVWTWKTAFAGVCVIVLAAVGYLVSGDGNLTAVVLFRLLIPMALWVVIKAEWLAPAPPWMRHNFFLYATHFAVVRLVNKTAAMLFVKVMILPLALYILMPVFAVFVSYWLGRAMRRICPGCWNLLNGGRI